MRKMGKHIPGLIVTLVVLITAIVFAVMLLNMKVIPTKFIAVIGLVMLVLIVIVGALVWSTDGKIRFVVGVILAAVFAAVFILGRWIPRQARLCRSRSMQDLQSWLTVF